jgi:hypothetical protein
MDESPHWRGKMIESIAQVELNQSKKKIDMAESYYLLERLPPTFQSQAQESSAQATEMVPLEFQASWTKEPIDDCTEYSVDEDAIVPIRGAC